MTPLRMLTTFAKYLTSKAFDSQTIVWGLELGENWMPSCNACSWRFTHTKGVAQKGEDVGIKRWKPTQAKIPWQTVRVVRTFV